MKLNLIPTGLASKDSKKKWLIHEIMRYRNFVRFTQTIKLFISGLIALGAYHSLGGWVGVLVMVLGVAVFDFFFEFYLFLRVRDFYLDLSDACFDGEGASDHDFRIIMNRVENFIKTKDGDRKEEFYKQLEECYTGLAIKTQIKESIEDIVKELNVMSEDLKKK